MKAITFDHIISILKSGDFDQFIEAVEDDRFECKAEPYRLEEEHQRYELAKDVSALANAKGGVILIGAQTERDPTHATDIIIRIRPFPNTLIKVSQYEDVVRTWVYPPINDIEIRWFNSSSDRATGVVGITVPQQDALWRPFLMTKTIEQTGRVCTTLFGYTERGNGKSLPMSVQQLHTILRDGYRVGIGALVPVTSPDRRLLSQPTEPLQPRIENAIEAAGLKERPSFILAATPTRPTELESLFSARDSEVVRLLENPPQLRPSGFGPDAGINSRIIEGKCRRAVLPNYKLLEVWRDGSTIMVASGDDEFLAWGSLSATKLKLNQLVLIECTYLFATLVKELLQRASEKPHSMTYMLSISHMELDENCVLFPGPLTRFPHGANPAPGPDFKTEVIGYMDDDPGIPSYQLISRLYHWFGFEDDKIPYTSINKTKKAIDPKQILDMNTRMI